MWSPGRDWQLYGFLTTEKSGYAFLLAGNGLCCRVYGYGRFLVEQKAVGLPLFPLGFHYLKQMLFFGG